ncbi:TPA: hypothetical protein HA265_03055 [Candidatus Woesearchaeota archaeon]|nr:hypothetical protein [Candidatus Woesearchaeota archaeon]
MYLGNEVQVKCRRCGKHTSSAALVLDPVYRMMVCPNCVKERLNPKKEEPKDVKPVGWDKDDEVLAKTYKPKVYTPDGKRKHTCSKCRHSFIHDSVKKYPMNCPMCGTKVSSSPF